MVEAHITLYRQANCLPNLLPLKQSNSPGEIRRLKAYNHNIRKIRALCEEMKQHGFDAGKYRVASNLMKQFDTWQ